MNQDATPNDPCKSMKSLFFEHDTLQRHVSLRLSVLTRVIRNTFDRRVSALQATNSQWMMIGIAARYPGSTQRSLAEYLDMSEASAGRLIDKLCNEGLLERRAREDDRRAREVYVTDAAKPLLETLSTVASQSEQEFFAGFTDEELLQMRSFLDRIYENATRA